MNLASLNSEYCNNVDEELSKIAIEQVAEDMDDIMKHFNNLNNQLLEKNGYYAKLYNSYYESLG